MSGEPRVFQLEAINRSALAGALLGAGPGEGGSVGAPGTPRPVSGEAERRQDHGHSQGRAPFCFCCFWWGGATDSDVTSRKNALRSTKKTNK